MSLGLTIPEATPPADRAGWAERIRGAWNKTREGVIEVGKLLIEAKAALEYGQFEAMIEAELPFSARTAQRLMTVASDSRITGPAHGSLLPPSWRTLYELSKLDDGTFSHAVTKGLIKPDMERKDAERLRTGQRRAERLARTEKLATQGEPLAAVVARCNAPGGRRFPVVYADPATRFETWSEKGQEKSADNHYPTMTFAELAALPVGELAADSAALWLWTTGTWLSQSLRLMEDRWGFTYKAQCCWPKRNEDGSYHRGTGYWFIDCHELLLVGTRGAMPAPLMGSQELSIIEGPLAEHSRKPEIFRAVIDRYFPGVGKIELFARGALPIGWEAWGNEVPSPEAGSGTPGVPAEKEAAE